MTDERPLTGRGVFLIFAAAFGIIIAVNVTLAVQAVQTFPGLEVKNSYVASQNFDADRAAQQALGWTVDAGIADGTLTLDIRDAQGAPARLARLDATLGRATIAAQDFAPAFQVVNGLRVAPVDLAPGNWDLRMVAVAEDGTEFRRRIEFHVRP